MFSVTDGCVCMCVCGFVCKRSEQVNGFVFICVSIRANYVCREMVSHISPSLLASQLFLRPTT